ncbi:MAG: ATP-dependent Clp protease adaptor ClpS [Desulfovibrio sp.]|nr:ATP-dependent Clp protease adaptor ClpS [Desulfovibrio sp.]
MANDSGYRGQAETDVENRIDEPGQYKVLMHNDNYTTMDFVVDVLRRIFHMPVDRAAAVMMQVHTKGVATCGIYTREIAETRIARVRAAAQQAKFPLKCTMEKV